MSTRLALATLSLTAAAFFALGAAFPQDPGAGDPQGGEMNMEDTMAAMLELGKPGPEHEELARGVGEWEQTITFWMPAMPGMPAMEPQTATATATQSMVLGGRFLMTEASGEWMGMPVGQLGFIGFDRRHGEYVSVGLDTMGTYFITARGKQDDDGVVRMHGEDQAVAGKQVCYFEVETSEDYDEQTTRLFFTQLGLMEFEEPFQMMELKATRKRSER